MINFSRWLNNYIWFIDGTLADTTNSVQIRRWSNCIERIFNIPQTSVLEPHRQMQFSATSGHSFWEVLPFCRSAVCSIAPADRVAIQIETINVKLNSTWNKPIKVDIHWKTTNQLNDTRYGADQGWINSDMQESSPHFVIGSSKLTPGI